MNRILKIILVILIIVLILGSVVWALISNDKQNNSNSNNGENNIANNEVPDNNELVEDNIRNEEKTNMENRKMKLKINGKELTATLVDNSSTKALLDKLAEGDITIDMHDFSNFEKVGSLGFSLPRNDTQISTDAGDLILYQGNSFVIYYDTNNWNFTRLGKIDNVSKSELKEILGNDNVTVTLSLD